MKLNCKCSVAKQLVIEDVPIGTCFKGTVEGVSGVFMRIHYDGVIHSYALDMRTGKFVSSYLANVVVEKILPDAVLNC